MQDTEAEKKEIKRRFQLWIRPSTVELAVMMNVVAANTTSIRCYWNACGENVQGVKRAEWLLLF